MYAYTKSWVLLHCCRVVEGTLSIPIRNSCIWSWTRVTKSYLLALGTTQISSYFTKHWTKFLTHQTGNYPVTCFVHLMLSFLLPMYIRRMCVLFTWNRSFYPSTSSTPSVRAVSVLCPCCVRAVSVPILPPREIQALWSQNHDTDTSS